MTDLTKPVWLPSVPEGWELSPVSSGFLLTTPMPNRLMATIDFEGRVFRSGFSTYGKAISTKKYKGRGWREQLVNDAVAWLTKLLRN